MRDEAGALIATKEFFPDTLGAAVRQKARWMVGIGLAGWDRLGWSGNARECWMRLRDRRGMLAALILLAAYLGLVVGGLCVLLDALTGSGPGPVSETLSLLLAANGLLLLWRLVLRMIFVWQAYGWREAVRAVPRLFVGNIIAMMAARRAMATYLRHLRGRPLVWDKTVHRFPDEPAGQGA
jgi:adsorption protein B